MRFLLNMNVPRVLGLRLTAAGHGCRHAGDIGLAHAQDVAILGEARTQGEVIVTHDLDYGHLLAFSGNPSPSVVIFRLRNTHPDNLFARMTSSWEEIERPLSEGAIVVLEDATVRIRRLPIKSQES
jgi:predicted nuclease of predicted toxin-antitoxin system